MTFDLAAAIKDVQPGDILTIPPGNYPFQVMRGRTFSPPVTLVSLDPMNPAQIDGFQATGVVGLRLVGLDIHMLAPKSAASPVVFFQSCSDIEVIGGKVHGSIDAATGVLFGKAISVADGTNITISGVEVFDFYKGASLANAIGFTLLGCDLHHGRTSPVDGGGDLQNDRILYNHIHDIEPQAAYGDHSDGIHFFTKNSKRPCDGLVIQGNLLEDSDAGGTLGINLEGTPDPGGFINARVVGNVLHWNNNQGITTNYVQGDVIGNILLPAPGLDDPKHAPAEVIRPTDKIRSAGNDVKLGPSMKPFAAQNTFLTAGQIAQMGAKV